MSTASDGGFDRKRVGLWVVFLVLLVGALVVAWQYVGTLMLGLFAYYVARPVFQRFQRRIPSRTLAVAVTLLVVALPVLLLVGWTLLVAVEQLSALLGGGSADQFGDLLEPYIGTALSVEDLERNARAVLDDPSQFDRLNQSATAVLSALLDSLVSALTALIHLFIALIVAFYLLRDDHRLAAWARETFVTPDGVVDSYLVAVDSDLQTVFFGNILNALLTAVLGVVTYSALNLVAPAPVRIPNPVLLGLVSGVASLVPVIGIKLVWVPISAYLLGTSLVVDPATTWFVALFAGVSVVVVDTIPDQLLRPYVSGRTLHVGAVMLAYTIGPLLFGWYGIFLGPFLLVVGVEFARHVFPWLVDPESAPETRRPEPTFAAEVSQTPADATAPADDEVVTGADPDTDTPTESVDADGQGTASAETESESDIEDGTAGEES
ncbi:AI-2E family transporter [Halorientalis salina]|uniref:AI-2E family transporter n=1 Tax=Halorientalis salina TaxID=2932266 RepID=UPI0010ACA04A|nr:AI-2E family transporter [Halorientalis salina]